MGTVTSQEFVAKWPELRQTFASFLTSYCTEDAGRCVSRNVLEAAFARHLKSHSVSDNLKVAAAALDCLCQERGFDQVGWVGYPVLYYHGVQVAYYVDNRVTIGISVDRFPTDRPTL